MYVHESAGIDTQKYQKIAKIINAHAYGAAIQFAELLGKSSTPQLVHFFHDMLMAICLFPNIKTLSSDSDIASAIIDGIHFEFYGDSSPTVIESLLHLWAEQPECFFQTLLDGLAAGVTGPAGRFVCIATYCVDSEVQLGATEVLALAEPFSGIVLDKAGSVTTFIETILEA